MPIYPFVCDGCGAEFEVTRKLSAMREPTACPACGEPARLVFTGVTVAGQAEDPAARRASKPQGGAGAAGWSHQGHTHGAGTGAHSHGLWDR